MDNMKESTHKIVAFNINFIGRVNGCSLRYMIRSDDIRNTLAEIIPEKYMEKPYWENCRKHVVKILF